MPDDPPTIPLAPDSAWAPSTRPVPLSAGRAVRAAPADGPGADLCHPALALRALVGVQGVLVLAVGVQAASWPQALAALGPALAAGLTGTLAWLVVLCALRRILQRSSATVRVAIGLLLAAALALLACVPLAMLDLWAWSAPRAAAVPLAGAALALPMVLWLEARARARRPADASARLAELQSRIRPHFLFNALNTAIALVRVEPQRAEEVLEDLAQLFRVALAEPRPATTLADEIELAQRYLAIEQLRFGPRMAVDWQLDPAAARALMPPLVLQPLVENAVRHGIENAADGGTIRVRTRARRGQAEIVIDNTVAGGAPNPGHGIALANVRERLRLLHDVGAQFDAGPRADGYRVRIVVPL
jgi:two-component system sensor histidine kinase AlgZ